MIRSLYSLSGAVISSRSILLFSLIFLLACGQTEQIGDKLNADELEYLRTRAAAKCVSDTNDEFADFIADSNASMLDFERDVQDWSFTNSSETSLTHKIYVWKVTTSAVYFHIVVDADPAKHIFLKYSKTANAALMREVQTDGCARGDYTSTVNSSTITMKKDDTTFTFNTVDNKYKLFRTWTFKSSLPGFFGFMEYVKKKQFYDNDGTAISNPASTTSTYAIKTITEADQVSTSYTNAAYPNRYYCLVNDYTTQLIDVTQVGDTTKSNLSCQNTNDTDDVTVGTETFDPDGELGSPF